MTALTTSYCFGDDFIVEVKIFCGEILNVLTPRCYLSDDVLIILTIGYKFHDDLMVLLTISS